MAAFLAGWAILRVLASVPILGGLVDWAAAVLSLDALIVAIWAARTTSPSNRLSPPGSRESRRRRGSANTPSYSSIRTQMPRLASRRVRLRSYASQRIRLIGSSRRVRSPGQDGFHGQHFQCGRFPGIRAGGRIATPGPSGSMVVGVTAGPLTGQTVVA